MLWRRIWGVPCGEELYKFFPHTPEALRFLARWAISAGEAQLAADVAAELTDRSGEYLPEAACLAAWQAQDWEKMADAAMENVAAVMQELFLVLLLALAKGDSVRVHASEMESLLPELQEILCSFAKNQPISADLWEECRAFLPVLAQRLPNEVLLRYVSILSALTPEKKCEAATLLLTAEKWQAAMALLAEIPADSPAADDAFWHDTGVAFYQMGDFPAARECFSRARALGSAAKDIAAYEAWMKGVGA